MEDFWLDKVVAVIGGTGSWGRECVKQLLRLPVRKVVVVSRDEYKQGRLAQLLGCERLRFLLGDVRDRGRMRQCLGGVDVVIHLAALKQVGSGSYCPQEVVKTNVMGVMNVAEACLGARVQQAIISSSDKAVAATTLYGGTKFVAEELWRNYNTLSPTGHSPYFLVARFGNALGSRGSVLEIWREEVRQGKPLTITDSEMTRFHISLSDAVENLLLAVRGRMGLDTPFVPIMPAYRLGALAEAFAPDQSWQIIGTRGYGEKSHEQVHIDLPPSNDSRWPRLSVAALREILQAEGWLEGK